MTYNKYHVYASNGKKKTRLGVHTELKFAIYKAKWVSNKLEYNGERIFIQRCEYKNRKLIHKWEFWEAIKPQDVTLKQWESARFDIRLDPIPSSQGDGWRVSIPSLDPIEFSATGKSIMDAYSNLEDKRVALYKNLKNYDKMIHILCEGD